nr:reverse transcriptase domain-containing protein [Tanacetum cinerariifolium]
MGQFPNSKGNKYILVAVDYLSKWFEVKALPTNDARVVVKFLKSLFSRFGTPKAIISDRGTHFYNDQFAKVDYLSTAYDPQTSGQVEVTNRGLKRILERTIGENRALWTDKLDDALWAFRTDFKTPIDHFVEIPSGKIKVNREAQQADALLTNELERYKEKEKHFAKYMTIGSEYCKKIKLLNDETSNLKSQACEKDKTFAKENEKYDEQTDQTVRMLLPKEDNVIMGKQGLCFENQNDDVNPSLLNKAKELAPCLYNIDEMGKYLLSDHKIISEEELKCEAEKRLKVKHEKSPLSYHGFVYAKTQFEEPPKVPLKRRNVYLKKHLEQTQNLKEHLE